MKAASALLLGLTVACVAVDVTAQAVSKAANGGLPDGAQRIELPAGPALRFWVTHLHGGGFAGRCYGYLDIDAATIAYMPVKDQMDHAFSVRRADVTARAPGFGPEVHLAMPNGTQKFIVVDRDMVERVRSALATRAHTHDPKALAAAVSSPVAPALPAPIAAAVSAAATTTRWDERFTAPLGSVYRLEEQLDFNVLDGAYFDAAAGQLTLYGHRDARYVGPQIPYLQHLAALLENPRPEMTLEWTPDSERRVHAFLNRTETREDAQRAAKSLAQFLDPRTKKVNDTGRLLLPGWGVVPTLNGSPHRGRLGVELAPYGEYFVQVVRVLPGSGAAAAGVRPGDVITGIAGLFPLNPAEVQRIAGGRGAGNEVQLKINDAWRPVRLGEGGNAWAEMDWQEVFSAILMRSRAFMAAQVLDRIYAVQRTLGTPAFSGAYTDYLNALGLLQEMVRLREQYGANDTMMSQLQPKVASRLEEIFELPAGSIRGRYEQVYARTRSHTLAGAEFDKALNEATYTVADRALSRLREATEGVQIAPDLVDRTWGVKPTVQPKFMGVRADTQLARAMVAADYLGKRLVNAPELKARLPAYQTQYEFLQRHPGFDRDRAAYRMWISVDRFRAAQSPDHATFEIREIAMRFNIREMGGAGRDLAPQPGDYQELLTSLYDDLARQYFILHELREISKVAGIAEWIHARDASFRLPAAGAATWRAPATLPGLVFVYLGGGNDNGRAPMTTFATGGVSPSPYRDYQKWGSFFDGMAPVDSSVVDLRHLKAPDGASAPVLTPRAYQNTELARIMGRKIDVPAWLPEGAVGHARNGERTLQTVTVLRARARACDTIDQNEKLEELELLGHQLAEVDRLINAANANAADIFKANQEQIAALRKDEARFKQQCIDMVSQSMFNLRSELQAGTLTQTAQGVKEAKELDEKVEKLQSRLAALRSHDVSRQTQELVEIARDLAEAIGPIRSSPYLQFLRATNFYSKIEKTVELGTSFVKVFTISDNDVEQLYQQQDTRLRVLDSLVPLKDRLQRRIDALQHDPALVDLCPP